MSKIPFKDHARETELFTDRVIIAAAAIVILALAIIGRLVWLQVIQHDHFLELSQENRITRMPIPPPRGLIFDRNGIPLARNLPSFSLEITPDHVPDMEKTLAELSRIVDVRERDLKRFRKDVREKHKFETIPLRFHLSDEEVARFAVNRWRLPGAEIVARMVRDYPLGELGAHAIGYVGRISEQDLEKIDADNYAGTLHLGKVGIEQSYEKLLHGQVGSQQVETSAKGRALRVLGRTPPVRGKNLYLSLDVHLQAIAEGSLGGKRGAIVAISTKTGEVLALASRPAFDPNIFVNSIDPEEYDSLQNSPDHPLLNRALRGQYPPGSTVKPFLGLAALEYGILTPDQTVFCPGYFRLGGGAHRYRDWKKEGHGTMNLAHAIEQSCDVFFYTLANRLGIDRMSEFMRYFGLGRVSGIDIPGESAGVMPSEEWKRKRFKQPWYGGETVITGIGQGYILVTPLQLAVITATMANHGTQLRPHLLRTIEEPDGVGRSVIAPQISATVPIKDPANITAIIEDMMLVVHGARGTAAALGRGASYKIAGKTGTAQVFTIKQTEKYTEKNVDERLRDHAWFVAFAPADDPQIAIAVLIENGGHGSSAAAPLAKLIMDAYLKKEVAP